MCSCATATLPTTTLPRGLSPTEADVDTLKVWLLGYPGSTAFNVFIYLFRTRSQYNIGADYKMMC